MSRLFAYMGNDQDRVKCALYPARKSLVADSAAKESFDAWGLGFYQGGEVLLQRRPKPPTEPVDFYGLVKDLRTDHETGNVQAVLDGDLDGFMEAFLRWRRAQQGGSGN